MSADYSHPRPASLGSPRTGTRHSLPAGAGRHPQRINKPGWEHLQLQDFAEVPQKTPPGVPKVTGIPHTHQPFVSHLESLAATKGHRPTRWTAQRPSPGTPPPSKSSGPRQGLLKPETSLNPGPAAGPCPRSLVCGVSISSFYFQANPQGWRPRAGQQGTAMTLS